jgi:hypothetical protein
VLEKGMKIAELCQLKTKCMQSFKDYIEEQMDLKRSCTIRFRDVQGAVTEIRAKIVKMDEVSGRQMIETDAGFAIGIDQIISVNGRPQENYC